MDEVRADLDKLHRLIFSLAINMNTTTQHYKAVPLPELKRDMDAFADYAEEQKRRIESRMGNK